MRFGDGFTPLHSVTRTHWFTAFVFWWRYLVWMDQNRGRTFVLVKLTICSIRFYIWYRQSSHCIQMEERVMQKFPVSDARHAERIGLSLRIIKLMRRAAWLKRQGVTDPVQLRQKMGASNCP